MRATVRAIVLAFVLACTPLAVGAVTSTAEAAVKTRVVFSMSPVKSQYKKTFNVAGVVQYYSGGKWNRLPDTNGGAVLERRFNGKSVYKPIRGDYDGGKFSFRNVAVLQNAYYRVRFTGGSGYAASTPAGKLLRVTRNLNDRVLNSGGKAYIKGNVDPGWGKRYVKVFRKFGKAGKWKLYAKVKTKANGAFAARIKNAPGTEYFFAQVNGSTAFVTSPSNHVYGFSFREGLRSTR